MDLHSIDTLVPDLHWDFGLIRIRIRMETNADPKH
jgi:hypothetical protein